MEFDVSGIDLAVVIGYLVFSRVAPLLLNKSGDDAEGYFLGGRNFVWPMIGFSLFATNMSGASFVSFAGSGYNEGIAVYSYEWTSVVVLVLFVAFLLPFYLKSGITTVPEFLERRYDRRSRLVFSGFLVFNNTFIDCAAALYAGAVVLQTVFPGLSTFWAIALLALLAGAYTVVGGLGAVVISDTIQAVVLFIGGTIVFFAALDAIPSWDAVRQAAPEGAFELIQPTSDAVLPWPGLFVVMFIINVYYWTANQVIVQRTFGAKTLDHGRSGALFAGLLKLPILAIMIMPGVMATALYPDLENADLAFPTLAFDLLPIGLRGLILAALIAAITSSVDSILNSVSTMVTWDFAKSLKPDASDRQLVRIGRIATATVMGVAILWAPQIANFQTLWQYLQSILAYVVPPVVTILVGGILWPRATKQAGFLTLAVGVSVGIVGFVMNEIFGVIEIQYLYASAVLFLFCVVGFVTVTLMGSSETPENVMELTWTPRLWREESIELESKPAWKNYRYQSVALLSLTAVIVGLFW